MNCDSMVAWFRNINCPEFKTGTELFRESLDKEVTQIQSIYSNFTNIFQDLVCKQNGVNLGNLFIELLPLLAGYDIAVLAFAAQFILQIQEKYTSSFKLRSVL